MTMWPRKWLKSSHSAYQSACVEISRVPTLYGNVVIRVRDLKDASRYIRFTEDTWHNFIAEVKKGTIQ